MGRFTMCVTGFIQTEAASFTNLAGVFLSDPVPLEEFNFKIKIYSGIKIK